MKGEAGVPDRRLEQVAKLLPELAENLNLFSFSDGKEKERADASVYAVLQTLMSVWEQGGTAKASYKSTVASIKEKIKSLPEQEYIDNDNLWNELDLALSKYIIFKTENPDIFGGEEVMKKVSVIHTITGLLIKDYEKKTKRE